MKTSQARFALVAVLLSTLIGCSGKTATTSTLDVSTESQQSTSSETSGVTLPVMGQISSLNLTDQDGNAYGHEKLNGKVTVANFFFTTCTATCPVQTAKLQGLQKQFAEHDGLQFLSVSVQPEVDTPEVLTKYAAQHKADTKRWSFVTGSRDDVWELSQKQFRLPVGEATEDQGMPIFHSPKFILLDGQRQIRGYFESSSEAELRDLKHAIEQLGQQAETGTTTDDKLVVANTNAPSIEELEDQLEQSTQTVSTSNVDIYVPNREAVIPAWLATRADAQEATKGEFNVLHEFQFHDTQRESGIDWEATIVADAAKEYVAAHYDHGNGIAVADIDGDSLLDIYLTSQIGANALFRNLGDGKFQNITEQTGTGLADRIGVTASFADYDNDGDPDLFVTTVRGGNALFRNEGGLKFTDVSGEARIDYVGHSSAAVFFDYDRDGWLDLFVTNVGNYTVEEQGPGGYYRSYPQAFSGHLRPDLTETSILFRNIEGKRFEDVTEATGLIDDSWSGAATPIDANDDGWPDIYTLDMQGHDEYFENQQGKGFKKKSREVFPKTPWGAMGVKVFDYDNDGRMDLYITDMHSDMSEHVGIEKEKLKANMTWPESMLRSGGQSVWGNALYHKKEDGTFEEVSDAMGAENYWPWGLSVGDLNADGWEDAFVASSMNLPLRYGINTVLLNNRGKKFLDSEFILGVEPRRDGICAKPWFTLNCDGDDKSHKYAKQIGLTSGSATVWSALGSRSSAIFDMDNDGDLDIITNDFNSPPMVLTSDLAQKHKINFLKIRLVGSTSNRDGIGATVKVTTSEGTQTKVHDGQSGYLSQSSKGLYFGLGDATKVDQVEVTWPTGKTQSVTPDKINVWLEIEEK